MEQSFGKVEQETFVVPKCGTRALPSPPGLEQRCSTLGIKNEPWMGLGKRYVQKNLTIFG